MRISKLVIPVRSLNYSSERNCPLDKPGAFLGSWTVVERGSYFVGVAKLCIVNTSHTEEKCPHLESNQEPIDEELDDDTIYPVTAYEVPAPR